MSKNTHIQWCDHTYNPWRGCRKVAPECQHCYITTTTPFRTSGQTHGAVRTRAGAGTLREPLAWERAHDTARRQCTSCGLNFESCWHREEAEIPCPSCGAPARIPRQRVFCLSLGDWLDDENVPIEWLADLLTTIHATPHLDWLLLTKRPQNWAPRMEAVKDHLCRFTYIDHDLVDFVEWWIDYGKPRANVWIGVSAGADQAAALEIPAHVHFLSCEPMLKPMDETHAAKFDWIIFGGESGKQARQCTMDWIRQGLRFCRKNHVAPFVKQLGSHIVDRNDAGWEGDPGDWPMDTQRDDLETGYQGAPVRVKLKHPKGGDPAEWPEQFRVREFPEGALLTSDR